MGSCICGHLAQTITELSPAEIHARAMERHGDWTQQSVEHCPASGLAIDHVIDEMLCLGMIPSDIRHLERLSDPRVLARVPSKYLRRQEQANAVQYMEAWAELLEDELGAQLVAAPTAPSSDENAATAAPSEPAAESPLQVTP